MLKPLAKKQKTKTKNPWVLQVEGSVHTDKRHTLKMTDRVLN